MSTILIIEDKASMAEMLKISLQQEGFDVFTADTVANALYRLTNLSFDAVVTDLKLPDGSGMNILNYVQENNPFLPVIVMTAFGSIETAVQAVKAGAYDFITKPFDIDKLVIMLKRAISQQNLQKENQALKNTVNKYLTPPMIIGKSPKWQEVMQKAYKVAPLKSTVLILGPSGSGKEIIARMIHHNSNRSSYPFVAVNCAAIPAELIESELFGHEKGAFSGAISIRYGKFELADKGTIFLDEIADMHKDLQAKILRILQENEFQRVGGNKTIKVDVRVIAASNKDLISAVEEGTFREDLYYRLNVFPIQIPPLKERKEDIPHLIEHFINVLSKEMGKTSLRIDTGMLNKLVEYEWKGNVRELKNAIERAIILSDGDVLKEQHFQLPQCDSIVLKDDLKTLSLHEKTMSALSHIEKQMITDALKQTHGNKTKAAEILKVSYKTLLTKIKEYKIN